MAKKKIYVVRKGYVPGIYLSWSDCEKQTKGYSGAEYKSYSNMEDATFALEFGFDLSRIDSAEEHSIVGDLDIASGNEESCEESFVSQCSDNPPDLIDYNEETFDIPENFMVTPEIVTTPSEKLLDLVPRINPNINYDTICVDGACSGNPGAGEYQCVDVSTNEVIFASPVYPYTTNNIMEFMALAQAIKFTVENGLTKPIYSDSRTAIAWVKNKKVNTTLKLTSENSDMYDLLNTLEAWLKKNSFSHVEILKWDTKGWGEIPADFGRK